MLGRWGGPWNWPAAAGLWLAALPLQGEAVTDPAAAQQRWAASVASDGHLVAELLTLFSLVFVVLGCLDLLERSDRAGTHWGVGLLLAGVVFLAAGYGAAALAERALGRYALAGNTTIPATVSDTLYLDVGWLTIGVLGFVLALAGTLTLSAALGREGSVPRIPLAVFSVWPVVLFFRSALPFYAAVALAFVVLAALARLAHAWWREEPASP